MKPMLHQSSVYCSVICPGAWTRYLTSLLRRKFLNVWGQALSWGNPQDWVKVLISETTPVWCFVQLHYREKLFTKVCATKHREHLSNLSTQLGHCVRDETWKLCSTNRVILRLECVATLEFDQLHLEVGWCGFHVNCKRITEQFKPTLLGFKVGKSACEVGAKYAKLFSK